MNTLNLLSEVLIEQEAYEQIPSLTK